MLSTGADLEGTVTDPSGARVAGATVRVIRPATGFERTLAADAGGQFLVSALPVGEYAVTVSADGFEPHEVKTVILNLGTRVALDIRLRLAGQVFKETVSARPRIDDVQRPGLSGLFTAAELRSLPNEGRNPLSLALLAPGAGTDRTPQQGASRTSGFLFSGQRARSNAIVVDGTDFNDQVVGGTRGSVGLGAVDEIHVLTNGFSAEHGKASGGVVNVVTRGGTNVPRGDVFWTVQDRAWSARNHFERYTAAGTPLEQAKAPYRQWQAGATFGGPLRRGRTFLFASIERRETSGSNLVVIDDRTAVPHPVLPGTSLGTAVDILRSAGFPVETGHVPYDVKTGNWLVRVDHQLTPRHRLTLRLNGADEFNEDIEPFGGLIARSRGAVLDGSDFMAMGSHLWVMGPRAANDFRVLIARHDQSTEALDPLCDARCDLDTEGGPTLEVSGVAFVGRHRFTPTPRDDTRYQFVDSFGLSGIRHTLKAGFDVSLIVGRQQALPLHFGGRYIFSPLSLPAPIGQVSSIQALALGLPAAYVQGYGDPSFVYDTADAAAFVEDVWTPTSALSIRYGIRYQRQFWPRGGFSVPGIPDTFPFPADTNDIAPRFGIAWSLAGDTAVRGGYGMYYDHTLTVVPGITHAVSGRASGVRTAVLTAPAAFAAWSAPGHRLSESAAMELRGGSFPSLVIAVDPELRTPYSHQAFATLEHRVRSGGTLSLTATFARGFNQIGTIDYNPVVPALGVRRRPADVDGVAGSSTSILQYTGFGETWYRGLAVTVNWPLPSRTTARLSYVLSKAEDTSTDFQSAFLPQDNGLGRDPRRPTGLPIDFDPSRERGPSTGDQRHRLVVIGHSELPAGFQLGMTMIAGSGWPYNVLAGSDLNGDGDGGAFPSDRARRVPMDATTAIGRNSARLPAQADVAVRVSRAVAAGAVRLEPTVEIFNLFNRTNFVDVNNVFGDGAYPSNPLPTFGQFTQAAPGRRLQAALRVEF